jgi:hypothetical protein
MVPNRTSGRKQSDSALEPRRTTGGAISRAWRGCMLRHMPCADIALARRIERAECRLSIGTAQAVIARAGDAFVVRFGGGAASFLAADHPSTR